MLSLVGFTYISNDNEKTPNESNAKNESLVKNSLIEFVDKGMMKASWYGPRFHGKLTANGEVYDQMTFTAAQTWLQFGTVLRITNPANYNCTILSINHR